jgi:hypothetical protein
MIAQQDSHNMSAGTASDSVASDDVFSHDHTSASSADVPATVGRSGSGLGRFSTGMLEGKERDRDGEKTPTVVKVEMRSEADGQMTKEVFPDDIYIDVAHSPTEPLSVSTRKLKVLPIEDDDSENPITNGQYCLLLLVFFFTLSIYKTKR